MIPSSIIKIKRDGKQLNRQEFDAFIHGFLDGSVTPYQMSAFLMAAYLKGLSPQETADLTEAMIESGETLQLSGVSGIKVDKHSTGGVGDMISLALAPLVAASGVPVPMISGRGLGHTGGTLDKLESISGLETGLDPSRFESVIKTAGFAMGSQTPKLAPADGQMYALRDVTATVESIPLIVSSILSKKVAAGVDVLVLDVKFGRGAFMTTEDRALELARELTRVSALLGKQAVAFITDMDQPLGNAVGNSLELRSAIECLKGRGPMDVMELVWTLGTAMVGLGKPGKSWQDCRNMMEEAVSSGEGLRRFRAMVSEQGGDPLQVDHPERLPVAGLEFPVMAEKAGFVVDVAPNLLGEGVVELGGGRLRAEDPLDPSVGILLHKKYGNPVSEADVLATVVAADRDRGKRVAEKFVAMAYTIEPKAPPSRVLIKYLVTPEGVMAWHGPSSWPY